jgi:hypothetical protein
MWNHDVHTILLGTHLQPRFTAREDGFFEEEHTSLPGKPAEEMLRPLIYEAPS